MQQPYEFFIITHADFLEALAAARRGSHDAKFKLSLCGIVLFAIQKAPMECVCLDCKALLDNKFRPPGAVAACVPMFPSSGNDAFACVVCEECGDRTDLFECALEALSDMHPEAKLWPTKTTRQ